MSAKWPGFSDEQARVIDSLVSRFQTELAQIRAPDRVLDRRGARAAIRPRPGDVVRTQADDVVVLPHPRSARGHAPVIILVESTPVRVLAESGTVNDVDSVEVTATGAMTWYSTGTEWWGSAVGGSSGSGGAPGDLPALSVFGRADDTAGPGAGIAASAARQVVRVNDDGDQVEWGLPIEVHNNGDDEGDAHTVNWVGARVTVAAGEAEVDLLPQLTVVNPISGTQNAYVIPSTVLHRDLIAWVSGGATVTLNGIDATDVPEGFQFTLNLSSNTFVNIVDEAGAASANNRISTPSNRTLALQEGATITFHRYATRWGVLEIGFPDPSTSIVYSGNRELQRAALTGFAVASQNSNATTSAEPLVTYSTSGNMSAERVLTSSTSNTVSTSVAGQIQVQRAPITGDVEIAANANTATIPNDTVTNAKAADMAANTLKANPTSSTADPQDLAIAANGVPFRVGSANLASHAPGPHQVLASDADGETDWRDAGTLLDATHYILRDDFSGGEQGFSSGTYGETGWKRVRNTDAGEEIYGVTDEVGHPGVVELELTTDTVDATVALVRGRNDFTAEVGRIAHGDLDFFEFVVRVPSFQADTGAQFQVGFGADPLDDDNNGEGVYFSLNLDTNGEPWIGVCRTGGSSDTTPTLVAGSVNWVRLTARKTATHWMFSANGGTEEAVPLSNAPIDVVLLGAFARIRRLTTGGGDHYLRVDFVRAHGTLDR